MQNFSIVYLKIIYSHRRRSVSTSQINECTGQIEGFHNGRRMTLFIPDAEDTHDDEDDEERQLRIVF